MPRTTGFGGGAERRRGAEPEISNNESTALFSLEVMRTRQRPRANAQAAVRHRAPAAGTLRALERTQHLKDGLAPGFFANVGCRDPTAGKVLNL